MLQNYNKSILAQDCSYSIIHWNYFAPSRYRIIVDLLEEIFRSVFLPEYGIDPCVHMLMLQFLIHHLLRLIRSFHRRHEEDARSCCS